MTGQERRPGLRVATYNTRDFLDDRAAAARVVRAIDPDVLCLQEVPRRLFARRKVRAFAAACAMDWSGRHQGSGGTTIFTSPRVRVGSAAHFRLPVRIFVRTRGYAVATVTFGAAQRSLTVVSVHLSLKEPQRVQHARAILARIADARPAVVCGDLNEGESGRAFNLIGTGLQVVSGPEPTYPAHRPTQRLDVIFASPDLSVLPRAEVTMNPTDLHAASDHVPTWVDFA